MSEPSAEEPKQEPAEQPAPYPDGLMSKHLKPRNMREDSLLGQSLSYSKPTGVKVGGPHE